MVHATVERISAEFVEMPGLRLTVQQAARLWALDPAMCKALLDTLVDAQFLRIHRDGTYARASDGRHVPRPQPAKAAPAKALASAS
jgi:hypothetical protein